MEPAEKGIYIDLICYQHINGSLPINEKKLAKICGIELTEFLKLWETVKHKFKQVDNRLVNQKVQQVVKQTTDRALKNKINGSIPRLLDKYDLKKLERKQVYKKIRESIDYNLFSEKSDKEIKDLLNQLVDQMVNYIANANANANINEDEDENILYPFEDEKFLKAWELWKSFKKEQFKFSYKPIGEQGALYDLAELSGGELQIAIAIIHQSIKKGWKGFFELKVPQGQDNISYAEKLKKEMTNEFE